MIAKGQDWVLSPAYDLTPTSPVSVEQRDLAMICGDRGRYASAENLLSQSQRFIIDEDEAKAIVNRMEHQVTGTWYNVARAHRVSERDCGKIAGAFAYPGFRLQAKNTCRK